jgi:asparagine synthase (glutamine-hydrolysing)
MCGIAGFTQFKQGAPLRMDDLHAMVQTLQHRGPDDEGYYLKKLTGLGMRRLSIIDLPGGGQPISNERGNVWVVFNGEIYNHQELRTQLTKCGHFFKTQSDTEVIVHAYEEYGDAFLNHLRGMFALAIWDEVFQKLLLAKDHLGVKPLYYTTADGSLLFASEIKALLQNKAVLRQRQIDPKQIVTLLTLQYVPAPDTLFKNIRKLLPGHYLICQSGKILTKQYWEIPDFISSPTPIQEAEAVEQLQYKLFSSVKEQMLADVPVGALLSGGIDSSMIVAAMTHQFHRSVRTYTVGFEGENEFNEVHYARKISKFFKTQHQELILQPSMLPELLPRLTKYLDDLIVDPASIPTFLVSLLARQEVKVLLSGEGADELFGGYRRYALDSLSHPVQKIPLSILNLAHRLLRHQSRFRSQQALEALQKSDWNKRHLAWVRLCPLDLLETIIGNTLKYELDQEFNPFTVWADKSQTVVQDTLHQSLFLDLKTWLPDDLLAKVDRMSMAASLEARVPYLDHRLVEFVFKLPANLKIRNFNQKYILKQAARKYLPASIIQRSKMGFGVPLAAWFRNELKPLLLDTLNEDTLKRRGWFDPEASQRLIQEHLKGHADHHLLIYGMLLLEWWQQHFLDMA